MKEPIFIKHKHDRFWKIEGIISEAKERHGLKQAHYRGLSKVQYQTYLTAAVQNIKRIITYKQAQAKHAVIRIDHSISRFIFYYINKPFTILPACMIPFPKMVTT